MIEINLQNAKVDLTFKEIEEKLIEISKKNAPEFVDYETDMKEIEKVAKKFKKHKNIILVANGGARTSFVAYYEALANYRTKKDVVVLTTMEPDFINELKAKYKKKDTLILLVSKSGTNICPIEASFAFAGYPTLIITSPDTGALVKVIKRKKIPHLFYPGHSKYPEWADRLTGATASGLGPAAVLDIDIDGIYKGVKSMYKQCTPDVAINANPALKIAAALFMLEKEGYSEIFCPIYSTQLFGFMPLITQLMHESVCKEGKGQTIFGDLAPEVHHHTLQRFFGGRKNVCGLFIKVEKFADEKSKVEVPKDLGNVSLRKGSLADLNKVPYAKALESEFEGASQDAINRKIPLITISVDKVTPKSVGELLALLQFVAIYSSWLRDVNPFDQPEVEESKEISFRLRKNFKK